MRLRRDAPHTLAGAYVLDAVGERDRARFERHLADCEVCRQEAAGLREATARLASATAVRPPERVREQVLAAAARTRQRPPSVAGQASGGAARGQRPGLVAPRLAVAIAGGCMLVALTLGGLFLDSQHHYRQAQAHSQRVAAVLSAPDATMMTARARSGGAATVVMSHRDRALVLTTARLPAPPSHMRYQVWLMSQGRMRSAGMLPEADHGLTAPMVVSGVAAGEMLGVTVEPAGGSAQPTSGPVLLVHLPS